MKRRTKIATILTTGLLSAALVGVGFAAWTIGGGLTGEQSTDITGTVSAETVGEGTGLSVFEAKITESDVIHFGNPSSKISFTSPWLTESGNQPDDLTIAIEVKIVGKISAFNVTMNELTGITEYVELEKYEISGTDKIEVSTTTFSLKDTTDQEFDGSENIVITATLRYKFDASSYDSPEQGTKYANPYNYYNFLENNKTHQQEAKTALDALAAFKSIGFKVTATPTVA